MGNTFTDKLLSSWYTAHRQDQIQEVQLVFLMKGVTGQQGRTQLLRVLLTHTFSPILRRPRQELHEFQASQGHSEKWKEKNVNQQM